MHLLNLHRMIQGYSRAQTQSIYKKANNKAGFKPPGSCNNKKETYFGFTVNNKTNKQEEPASHC